MAMHYNRRDLLRYGTAAIFLYPILRSRGAHAATESVGGLVQCYIPNGCRPSQFYPSNNRLDFTGMKISEPFNRVNDKMCMIRDVFTDNNIHSMVPRVFTNGVSNGGRSDGPSLDWVVSEHLLSQGIETPFRGLHLGVDNPYPNSGVQGTPIRDASGRVVPVESDPLAAFNSMFANYVGTVDERCADSVLRERQARESVLDSHRAELASARVQLGLGAEENRILDEYEAGVAELEQQLGQGPDCSEEASPELSALGRAIESQSEGDKSQHGRLMAEIVAWAFRLGLTKTASLTFFSEGGDTDRGKRRNIDVASWFRVRDGQYNPDGDRVDTFHHHLSHFDDSRAEGEWHCAVNRWALDAVCHLAETLDGVDTDGGTLLDRSGILYMSSGGDGARHRGANSPAVIIGGVGGSVPTGDLDFGRAYHGSVLCSVASSFGVDCSSSFGSNPDGHVIERLW